VEEIADERTPGEAAERDPDPLVGEIWRERRDRRVLVIAAAIGIISGAVVGMAFLLGRIDDAAAPARGFFAAHDALSWILAPPVLSVAIGYAIFALRRRRAP
jgi:hypothetical protein